MTGLDDIIDERYRQMTVEGWTFEHDDAHTDNSLVVAAIMYAMPPTFVEPFSWPWDKKWDKRAEKTKRRRLVIAAALLAAEIDRMDRAGEK